jgi:DNA primase
MAAHDVGIEQLTHAGLIRRDDESGRTFELFSNRVMFPIKDRRGRIISFGGRILGVGQPKYVNGPETPVFVKRQNLYGLDRAREGVRAGATLIVVEGYMDVIAAAQAGFTGAVAPLGTALTTEQLDVLWRESPSPVLCFDGDGAGLRAAARVMELALPMLTPARSLRFATLPSGDDPDSLVRKSGASAFQAVLDAARSPSQALYDMVRDEIGDSSPEKRAALRSRLIEACGRIADKSLASEYRGALLDRFFASRTRPGKPKAAVVRFTRPVVNKDRSFDERTRILTAIIVRHPRLLHDVGHAYDLLPMENAMARLRHAIEDWADHAVTLDSAALMHHLTRSGFQHDVSAVLSDAPLRLPACASGDAMPAEAEEGWWHIFGFLNVDHLQEEVELARADAARDLTPETQRRLVALTEALNKVRGGEPDGVGLVAA